MSSGAYQFGLATSFGLCSIIAAIAAQHDGKWWPTAVIWALLAGLNVGIGVTFAQ